MGQAVASAGAVVVAGLYPDGVFSQCLGMSSILDDIYRPPWLQNSRVLAVLGDTS